MERNNVVFRQEEANVNRVAYRIASCVKLRSMNMYTFLDRVMYLGRAYFGLNRKIESN